MLRAGKTLHRAHYRGPAIEAGDLVWHPKFGRGIVSRLELRVTEHTGQMIMPTGVVHVAQAPGGSAELAGIGIFTTDWMDLCLLRRQPGWAPQQGRAPQPEPAADLPAYYAGEQILVGDLVQESVDQALYRFIAGVHPPGQPPDAYDHIEAYSAEQSEHGTCTMTWPGAHPSVRDQIFSLYDLTWDDLVLVRRGPPYPWML